MRDPRKRRRGSGEGEGGKKKRAKSEETEPPEVKEEKEVLNLRASLIPRPRETTGTSVSSFSHGLGTRLGWCLLCSVLNQHLMKCLWASYDLKNLTISISPW